MPEAAAPSAVRPQVRVVAGPPGLQLQLEVQNDRDAAEAQAASLTRSASGGLGNVDSGSQAATSGRNHDAALQVAAAGGSTSGNVTVTGPVNP
jgi:hypothetical protein